MIATLLVLATIQTTKMEPVLGGIGEAIFGIRVHPEQKLGLYMRRSMINARLDQAIRQAANDPYIRVGETRTSVREVSLDGDPCLLLESSATREILSHNPMEGERHPRVVRKISRTRKVWVADDGSIVKTVYEQVLPDAFTVEMLYGEGFIIVKKSTNGKKESAQVELNLDLKQFENEFLPMAWNKKVFKEKKPFIMLDPFGGTIRSIEAKVYGPFQGLEGTEPISGYRVDVTEGKATATAWVTNDGRLLQYDMSSGDRLIVEPAVGEPGVSKVKMGRSGG